MLDGYCYVVDRKRGDVTYWRCEERGSCGGRLKTKDDVVQGTPSQHSHASDPARTASLKAVNAIKEKAKSSDEVTSTIIQNCTSDFPLSAAGSLPNKETLSRMVRRMRSTPDGSILSEELRSTIRGENFVLHESEDLVVLSTGRNLQLLATKQNWLGDGTFDSAPLGFQLYTIHVMLDETHTVPLVYCLAKQKNQATYDKIFRILKQERTDLNPTSFTIDYERAAMNSIVSNFPQTTIYGCLFHFGQCLWREIQRCGLQSWYNAPDNALIVKSFFALSFIPICDVIDAFTSLVSSLDNDTDEILAPFLTYFETTWIGVVQRGRRRRPAFDIRIWNSVERTTEGLPRTTNSLEGWHRGFEQRLAIKHPSVCKLVAKLRKEQSDWELTIEMVMSGVELRKQKKKYQKLNARISSLVDKYNAYTTVDFLRAVAHNL